MRERAVLGILLLGSAACGGTMARDGHEAPSPGATGTGASTATAGGTATGGATSTSGSATGGSSTLAPDGRTSEPLDDTAGQYPTPPEAAGGAFFWRYGLGNWFVSSSTSRSRDGTFQDVEGVRIWKASAAVGEDIDLWAQLNHPQGWALDLSAYSGISFDYQTIGASQPLEVAFNANGLIDIAQTKELACGASTEPPWLPCRVSFAATGQNAAGISSFDFIVRNADAPFDLLVRNVSLLCKGACP